MLFFDEHVESECAAGFFLAPGAEAAMGEERIGKETVSGFAARAAACCVCGFAWHGRISEFENVWIETEGVVWKVD